MATKASFRKLGLFLSEVSTVDAGDISPACSATPGKILKSKYPQRSGDFFVRGVIPGTKRTTGFSVSGFLKKKKEKRGKKEKEYQIDIVDLVTDTTNSRFSIAGQSL